MIELHTRIDRGHPNVLARRDLVQLVQMPERAPSAAADRADRRAKGRERDSPPGRTRLGRRATSARSAVRAARLSGASMTKQSTPSAGIGQLPDDPQLESCRELLGNPLPVRAAGLRRIAADIAGIGTKVERRQAKHHQHFASRRASARPQPRSPRPARRSRARTAPAASNARRQAARIVIGPPARPTARRSAPCGSARSFCTASPDCAAGTSSTNAWVVVGPSTIRRAGARDHPPQLRLGDRRVEHHGDRVARGRRSRSRRRVSGRLGSSPVSSASSVPRIASPANCAAMSMRIHGCVDRQPSAARVRQRRGRIAAFGARRCRGTRGRRRFRERRDRGAGRKDVAQPIHLVPALRAGRDVPLDPSELFARAGSR